ncbi:DUF5658 family protein [Desulfocurvibacter africanus]|uniref:DUF5658 domain-containing protein n=1 Tax=Desulfocurvibacter africanus subsp. africanus str. Walvis Bay TaxID=690850 RepID=F3Z470_DESAF|nr:DUF5658 family protein [Desulfocurvibacter africanus]EGJ51612.1 hypothetical protein Desaf_3322 [Desulfocurvibacter africanus subsp. africanus str. Walvis Bay]
MLNWTLAALLVLLQVPDILTTNAILAAGGRELNPVMRLCMRLSSTWRLSWLPWWMPKLVVALGGAWILGASEDTDAIMALVLLVLAYLAVVGSNLMQLRRLRARQRRR